MSLRTSVTTVAVATLLAGGISTALAAPAGAAGSPGAGVESVASCGFYTDYTAPVATAYYDNCQGGSVYLKLDIMWDTDRYVCVQGWENKELGPGGTGFDAVRGATVESPFCPA